MIVDASAILAILLDEPDAKQYAGALAEADAPRIPAPNWFEVVMRLESLSANNEHAVQNADRLLSHYTTNRILLIEAFTAQHAIVARQAFRQYGKGRHPAGLNFGDCIAYAVAKSDNLPLLFKGNDFPKTDIEPALKH